MASTKEALGIIIDVGSHMNQAAAGEETDLKAAVAAVTMILQRKLFSESKDEIALILCGTVNTANDLASDSDETYQNITVARPLGPVDWELLDHVQNEIQPSNTSADFLDAIVVAMNSVMTSIQSKRGFVSKRVILFSNVCGEFTDDQMDDILASMKENDIELDVVGPDLDEDEDENGDDDGPQGGASNHSDLKKPKTPQQREGEKLLRHILKVVDGQSHSFEEVLPVLSHFQSRMVRPMPWKCQMEVGQNLAIPISGYIKIKEAKPKSWKKMYAKDADAGIENARTFHLNDEAETEIDVSETVDGHRYGSTLVPFSEDDKEAMKFRASKCLKILAFTSSDRVRRSHVMGDSVMMILADKDDDAAAVALSALIQGLVELDMVAIVRRVYAGNSGPKVGCLIPDIHTDHECLIYHELPFAEDVRQNVFGSLPVKGEATPGTKKYVPSDEQLQAMDELIDSMDLVKPPEEDGDGIEEYINTEEIMNPHLQRMYQCLQSRAVNPDDPLPELTPVIAESIEQPIEVKARCESAQEKVMEKFKFKEVSKKKDATADSIFQDNDGGGEPAAKKVKIDDSLDGGMADLVKSKVTQVGTVKPVDDFLDLINQKDEDKFDPACDMMQKRIQQIVNDSFGTQFYGKAIDCLRALREQSIKNVDPDNYNQFLRKFKDSLQSKGRNNFWEQAMSEKLSLITKLECEESKVSKEEAETFTSDGSAVKEEAPAPPPPDDDDLLDDF